MVMATLLSNNKMLLLISILIAHSNSTLKPLTILPLVEFHLKINLRFFPNLFFQLLNLCATYDQPHLITLWLTLFLTHKRIDDKHFYIQNTCLFDFDCGLSCILEVIHFKCAWWFVKNNLRAMEWSLTTSLFFS